MSTSPPSSSSHPFSGLALLKGLAFLALLYLFGPASALGYRKGRTLSEPPQKANERLGCLVSSTLSWLLVYVLLWFWYAPLASFWSTVLLTFVQWLHVPLLAPLSNTVLFPPTFSNLLWRWTLALPLTNLFALLFLSSENHPKEVPKRILTNEEQHELAALQATKERKRLKAEQTHHTPATAGASSTATTPRRRRSASTTIKVQATSSLVPSADSLWGAVHWSQVPDDHPTKQAALRETGQRITNQREAERDRWLRAQQAALPPATHTTSPEPSSPPSALSSPQETPDDDEYDWNQGEGTVREQ